MSAASRRRLAIASVTALALESACGGMTDLRTPDPAAATTEAALCVDADADARAVTLELGPRVRVADVVFVLDRTGSMTDAVRSLQADLRSHIVPQILATIPDAQFGLATYGDFGVVPYGADGDELFALVAPATGDVAAVDRALAGVQTFGGGDRPEALVEALYQIATGTGCRPWGAPQASCLAGRRGGACTRDNAETIVLVVTDAPSHNGPDDRAAYPPDAVYTVRPDRPHTFAEATAALAALRAHVIGIRAGTDDDARADLEALARDTGAVAADGTPLVFDAVNTGSDLAARIVAGIETFVREARVDVTAHVVDTDPRGRATRVIRGVHPAKASPAANVARRDASTFYGAAPATQLSFTLDVDPAAVPRESERQVVRARVVFTANGTTEIGTRDVAVVIPAAGDTCPSPNAQASP